MHSGPYSWDTWRATGSVALTGILVVISTGGIGRKVKKLKLLEFIGGYRMNGQFTKVASTGRNKTLHRGA